jgi:hypothetical protein
MSLKSALGLPEEEAIGVDQLGDVGRVDEFGVSNRFYFFIFIVVTSIVLWNYIESNDKLDNELDYLQLMSDNRDLEIAACSQLVSDLAKTVAAIGRSKRQDLREAFRVKSLNERERFRTKSPPIAEPVEEVPGEVTAPIER